MSFISGLIKFYIMIVLLTHFFSGLNPTVDINIQIGESEEQLK